MTDPSRPASRRLLVAKATFAAALLTDVIVLRSWLGASVAIAAGIGMLMLSSPRRSSAGVPDEAARGRSALITACIEVSDRVESAALREQLMDALADAGVTAVDVPEGDYFDPSCHRAVGRIHTPDRHCHNRVATTERTGFMDRDRRLRCPDVLVFNADGGARQ
jgi:hypothetical protein